MQTLKLGSKGSAVKTLQTLLNASTQINVTLKVDGDFGKATKAAVKSYQVATNLEADGVVGPITWAKLQGTNIPVSAKPVDYKQYDSRWAKKLYTSTGNKNQTMAKSACGPTSMADVVATFFDSSVTPYDLAQLSVKKGFRTVNSGTSWNFFDFMATQYEFSAYKRTTSHDTMINALSNGALVVCSMGPGYWTSGGHFICAWKSENGYIYANDPASGLRTKQKISEFQKQRKCYFIFYPPIGWNEIDDDDLQLISSPTNEPIEIIPPVATTYVYSGPTGIYDVSKWQGSINWAKVKASGKVGLMIVRAGFGQSTVDTRFIQNMKGIAEQGIPFAVYWFSYATSVERAENEAASLYKIASPYKPLFYVMDCEDRCLKGEYIDAFAKKIKALSSGKIVAYIANHLFNTYKAITSLWDAIWIPKYMKTPPDHKPCDLWQKEGTKINGISGSVDTNYIPESGRYPIEWWIGLQ